MYLIGLWLSRGLCGFMRVMLGGYRVKSEKPYNFYAPALSASCIVIASLVLFALVLLFVLGAFPLLGCVVGVSFSLWMIATKRKGGLFGSSSLSVLFVYSDSCTIIEKLCGRCFSLF